MMPECLDYLRSHPGWHPLLLALREKSRSARGLHGTIVLTEPDAAARTVLSGLLGRDFSAASVPGELRLSVRELQAAWQRSRFQSLGLEDVLQAYFGGYLSHQQDKAREEEIRQRFFDGLMREIKEPSMIAWLNHSVQNGPAYRLLMRHYKEQPDELRHILIWLAPGLARLPLQPPGSVAVFAAELCRDPHALDVGSLGAQLLYHILAFRQGCAFPDTAESRQELLFRVGIISNELMNFTICSGFHAADGVDLHEGWEAFYRCDEPLNISLRNLATITRVWSDSDEIFIFENPSVFAYVQEQCRDLKPALICSNGQVKLSTWSLLDKALHPGLRIHYAGDFDVGGLLIAESFRHRYGERLVFWRYSVQDYRRVLSDKPIPPQRVKLLEKVRSPELLPLVAAMREEKRAAFQESLLEEYVKDVRLKGAK